MLQFKKVFLKRKNEIFTEVNQKNEVNELKLRYHPNLTNLQHTNISRVVIAVNNNNVKQIPIKRSLLRVPKKIFYHNMRIYFIKRLCANNCNKLFFFFPSNCVKNCYKIYKELTKIILPCNVIAITLKVLKVTRIHISKKTNQILCYLKQEF